jgi:hypothetical protein
MERFSRSVTSGELCGHQPLSLQSEEKRANVYLSSLPAAYAGLVELKTDLMDSFLAIEKWKNLPCLISS